MTRGELARLIDHTLLRPEATQQDIETLCREAVEYRFSAVCVNPAWVPLAVAILKGGEVSVCAVVAFPLGATMADVKAYEARRAIANGAREIDGVMNIGALKSGNLDAFRRDIEAVTVSCREGGALSKVIIETALLTDDEKVSACVMAKAVGADFVKTCTGFGPGGATIADVALMRRAVGSEMGVKASGGIRNLTRTLEMVAAGATRIGTSAGVQIMQQAIRAHDD